MRIRVANRFLEGFQQSASLVGIQRQKCARRVEIGELEPNPGNFKLLLENEEIYVREPE